MAAGRLAPGSLAFLGILLLGGAGLAFAWARLGYGAAHLEGQGIDIVHHAIIVHQAGVPGGETEYALGEHLNYPRTSHRLPALALGLFDGDAVTALRWAALACLFALLAVRYTLLCRLLPPAPALVVLLAWEALCVQARVGDLNYFMWEGQYNYSRAAGAVGLWLSLLLLTTQTRSAPGRTLTYAGAVGGAAFAFACHVAPGAVAFAALGLFAALAWWRERRPAELLLLAGTAAAGLYMLLATGVWTYMVGSSAIDGWMPVRHYWLLLAWVPTAAVAAVRTVRWGLGSPDAGDPTRRLESAVSLALLVSGALQGYAALKCYAFQTCAPYAVKSLFFYTLPLAVLLWVVWLRAYAPGFVARVPAHWREALGRRRWPGWAVCVLLLTGALWTLARKDPGLRVTLPNHGRRDSAARRPEPERLPFAASSALAALPAGQRQWYYFDPDLPLGAFYGSVVGLRTERSVAAACLYRCLEGGPAALRSSGFVQGVYLPRAVDPHAVWPGPLEVEEAGPFWRCTFPPTAGGETPAPGTRS